MIYSEFLAGTGRQLGRTPRIVGVPVLTPRLSTYWVDLVTDVPKRVAHPLIDGLRNPVVVTDGDAIRDVVPVELTPLSEAIALQLGVFEAGVLLLTWWYGLPAAAVPGTAAVAVAGAGSVAMLRISRRVRAADLPDAYRRVLFGSSVEVVLGVLAFVGLVTYLFVVDPRSGDTAFVSFLLGQRLPAPAVYLALLVLWDLCYRIGTAWWLAVANLWGTRRFAFDGETAASVRRITDLNAAFGAVQAGVLPFLRAKPVLFAAVGGHPVAVGAVSLAARTSVAERSGASEQDGY